VTASVSAVWWLRRDSAPRVAPVAVAHVDAPSQRVVAHAVRPVGSQPAVAASPAATPARTLQRRPSGTAAGVDAPTRAGASAAAAARRPEPGVQAPAPASGAALEVPGSESERETAAAREEERENRQIDKAAEDVIAGMRAAGETRGLAAMPPHGTDPVKSGLIVPKDFELPEGYIRHYQTTDDGKRLEAILMFSPDYTFVDDAGKPIDIPADRIVPPDMAPPGLPLRTLVVPGAARSRPAESGEREAR
jgi:hypothetical protein